ncbi:MAG: hypothetical protein E7348_00615 [Clostridiales bacterium]|nr:hypothetical protein [Clostridiales bacterium]
MKVLILAVTAGEGHNSISKAIASQLGDRAEVKIYDLFKNEQKFMEFVVNDFYFWSCKNFLKLSNALFRKMRDSEIKDVKHTSMHKMLKKTKPRILKLINDYQPDMVFCAHTYAAHIMSEFKENGLYNNKVFYVVSDYDLSPCIETCTFVDYVISPNADFDDILIKKGFKKEQILPIGIPVAPKFAVAIDKKEIRARLGVSQDKFVVFIMNGGVGFGRTEKLIQNLCKANVDFEVICVCGKNKKLKAKIDKYISKGKYRIKVYNYGFVNNVEELMSASDCYIGKMGGLSINEALNKGLPLISIKKLPWQEYDNMVYLTSKGVCDYIYDDKKAYLVLENLITTDGLFDERKNNIKCVYKPNAIFDIVDKMLEVQ